jgi:membrane associated rhomboid family serine protease
MIPIGDSPKARLFPWVNYTFIAINIIVFVYTLGLGTNVDSGLIGEVSAACYGLDAPPTQIDELYCRWGFQPAEFLDVVQGDVPSGAGVDKLVVLLSLVSSMFLHAGWLHIAGNMLFLWVFGDNIESRFGHLGYIAFYFAGGLAATFAQTAVDVDSLIPTVGASGAVSAVLGTYILLHPGATERVLVPLYVVLVPITVPAVLMIGLWFAQNLLAGFAEFGAGTAAGSGVAYFAHIGGFIFGAILGLIFSTGGDQPPAVREPVPMRIPRRPPRLR